MLAPVILYLVLAVPAVLAVPHAASGSAPGSGDGQRGPSKLFGEGAITTPGGDVAFEMELERGSQTEASTTSAWVINGGERIAVPVDWVIEPTMTPQGPVASQRATIRFDHYDAVLDGLVDEQGSVTKMNGEWRKRRSATEWSRLPFHAELTNQPPAKGRAAALPGPIDGRWSAKFASETIPAIGVFRTEADGTLAGTFLTTSGDYRFLAGEFRDGELRLTAFDGSHAFLFKARLQGDKTLAGEFWAGANHHDSWTAERDDAAKLPDGFTQVKAIDNVSLSSLSFPDLNGATRSLGDPRLMGKATIIQLFGSWCPNCHDEGEYLTELYRRYMDRGVSIIGLAFELTGDRERDAEQVRRYVARHHIEYPVLLAGVRDREKAAAAFPLFDAIPAYPTTLFVGSDGRVRAVHVGFSGPATGEEYVHLKAEFERTIDDLLSGKTAPQGK